MKFGPRQRAILEALLSWSESSDVRLLNEPKATTGSTLISNEALNSLELPAEALLNEIWKQIAEMSDNSTGNADIVFDFGTDPDNRYVTTGLLVMLAEDPEPNEWFTQALQDPIFNFLLDTRGSEAYDLEDEIEEVLKPILNTEAFEEILFNLLRLAESGPRNNQGLSFCQVLDGEGLLPA